MVLTIEFTRLIGQLCVYLNVWEVWGLEIWSYLLWGCGGMLGQVQLLSSIGQIRLLGFPISRFDHLHPSL